MDTSHQDRSEDEITRLRQALDAATLASFELQKRLDRANEGFEEFVSMAAHNMRESLRDVAAFSDLMAEARAGADSEDIQPLQRIREGAARMQTLLADVVDFWATGSGDRQASPTDMEAVFHQTLLSADKLIAERGAIVTHDPLPWVRGNFAILTKVLNHLLRNAIEYCGDASPRVHISARLESEWVFSVQDNGPGIDPAFHGRIFEPFKRLHGKEHPGNGLGLAFCRKAVDWYGGRMWLESKPGAGSKFYFALPPND